MNLKRKHQLLFGILVVFYTVGIVGISGAQRAEFLALSPLNLLLSLTCLLLSYGKLTAKQFFDFCLIGLVGFLLEIVGTKTSFLFGDYRYGTNLGWKLVDVPFIMSINWILLCFTSTAIVVKMGSNLFVQATIASVLMTGLDVLIEPVALKSNFWIWDNNEIPVFNYLCWFLLSLPLNWWILKRKTTHQNIVSVGLFVLLAVFFGILNFV